MDTGKTAFLDEKSQWALLDWALSYLEGGNFDEAVSALDGVARLNRNDPLPWAAAALAASLGGRRDLCQGYYLELVARHPNSPYINKLQSLVNFDS